VSTDMRKATECAAKASCSDQTLTAEFAAMRQMPHNQAATRAALLAVLCVLVPISRGADPPESGPGEAVAVGLLLMLPRLMIPPLTFFMLAKT